MYALTKPWRPKSRVAYQLDCVYVQVEKMRTDLIDQGHADGLGIIQFQPVVLHRVFERREEPRDRQRRPLNCLRPIRSCRPSGELAVNEERPSQQPSPDQHFALLPQHAQDSPLAEPLCAIPTSSGVVHVALERVDAETGSPAVHVAVADALDERGELGGQVERFEQGG